MIDGRSGESINSFGLFAGVGGLELGFARAGAFCTGLCEWDVHAQSILKTRFRDLPLFGDVRQVDRAPSRANTLLAGFPCQDLSQAGKTVGIGGRRSGLVAEVFRLAAPRNIRHVVLENVPFMLRLDHGRAMSLLTSELEDLGFRWAYRVLDSRGFGVAQRRRRVFVIASRDLDPARKFFPVDQTATVLPKPRAFGFYWTEGNRGLGWAEDAIPTLKCGSGLGIPSPPAIWLRHKGVFIPSIEDAEALQGFDRGWTDSLDATGNRRRRWALVGNAVTVPVAEWVANRLMTAESDYPSGRPIATGEAWPAAAFGGPKSVPKAVQCSEQPLSRHARLLDQVTELNPLSERATRGFFGRLQRSTLQRPKSFDQDLKRHIDRMAVTRSVRASRA
jgi:DNA (cytosine-5)-methyltransferase 1